MKFGVFATVLLVIGGCAATPPVSVEGETYANRSLLEQHSATVVHRTDTQYGCREVEKIKMTVIEPPSGEVGGRSWKERWIAYGCDSAFAFVITFFEKGEGNVIYAMEFEGETAIDGSVGSKHKDLPKR